MNSLKTSWYHTRRSPYQALAAILVMSLMLFSLGIFILLAVGTEALLKYFENKPQITAFFKQDLKQEELLQITNILDSTGLVESLKYVSQEEALAIYQEQNKDDPLLLELVSADILPASLEISAKDVKELNTIAKVLKDEPKVDEVVFQEEVVERLLSWTNSLRRIGIVLVGFLALIAFLVVVLIIGMKIATRKEEIEILRLLGASTWYIRLPFIYEGLFYSLVSVLLAWSGVYVLVIYSRDFLNQFLEGVPPLVAAVMIMPFTGMVVWPPSTALMLVLLMEMMLAALFVGMTSAYIAVRRYLRL